MLEILVLLVEPLIKCQVPGGSMYLNERFEIDKIFDEFYDQHFEYLYKQALSFQPKRQRPIVLTGHTGLGYATKEAAVVSRTPKCYVVLWTETLVAKTSSGVWLSILSFQSSGMF